MTYLKLIDPAWLCCTWSSTLPAHATTAVALQVFFEQYVPLDKLVKRVSQLSSVRELLDSRDPEGIVLGYGAVVELNPAVTPAMVEKMVGGRCVACWHAAGLECFLLLL